MALRWDFTKKSGTLIQHQNGHDFTLSFYEGNALMITTYEYEEDGREKYDLMWFFAAQDHAERCLGLADRDDGTRDNMFADEPVTSITFYRDNCRNWQKIAALFAGAFPNIVIIVLPHEPDAQ